MVSAFWTNVFVRLVSMGKIAQHTIQASLQQNARVVVTGEVPVVLVNVFVNQVSLVQIVKVVQGMNVRKVKV